MSYVIKTPQNKIQARSENQEQYLKAVGENTLTFGIGPAGTGKTFLAVAMGVEMLMRQFNQHTKNGCIKQMIITRPAIEAGERLGFLPGDLAEKVDPYMRPIFDALYETLGMERTEDFLDKTIIEVAPLAFMRGRTLKNAIVILDEAQNATRAQMKMFLTRIGDNTKFIVNGDTSQIDIPERESGLLPAANMLFHVDGIDCVIFKDIDVQRHPLVKAIIHQYAKSEALELTEGWHG